MQAKTEVASRLTRLVARVAMSPYIRVRPSPGQMELLLADDREVLLSGGSSSGKSVGTLIASLMTVDASGSAALVVVPALADSSLVSTARQWLAGTDARWDASGRRWYFPNGSILALAHRRSRPAGPFQFIGIDDLVSFTEDDYRLLMGLLAATSDAGGQLQLRAASSPDGAGREWVGRRFGLLGATGFEGRRVVRAALDTNPGVDAESIRRSLAELPEPRRSWLLHGDWSAGEARKQEEDREGDHHDEHRQAHIVPAVIDGSCPRVLLGSNERGGDVWYDPFRPDAALRNAHVLLSGESGGGKTQCVQALAAELHRQGVMPLVLDFKDDYIEWAGSEGIAVLDPSAGQRLPFNPLVPAVDRHTGEADALRHTFVVCDLVMRVWGLGDQQVARLREAVKAAYEAAAVPLGRFRPGPYTYPTFADVREYLDPEDTARSRLSPLFDLDPFSSEGEGLGTLLDRGAVIRLAQLPGSEFKAAVAEFCLLAIHDELLQRGHQQQLRSLLVLDEGWRLASCPFLEPLLREGRALGLVAFVASQFASDLPPAIRGNAATQLHFGQTVSSQAADVRRAVLGDSRGRRSRELEETVQRLPTFHAVVHSRQHMPWLVARVAPYFERS